MIEYLVSPKKGYTFALPKTRQQPRRSRKKVEYGQNEEFIESIYKPK